MVPLSPWRWLSAADWPRGFRKEQLLFSTCMLFRVTRWHVDHPSPLCLRRWTVLVSSPPHTLPAAQQSLSDCHPVSLLLRLSSVCVHMGFTSRCSASDTGCLGNWDELQGSHPEISRVSSHTVTRGMSSVLGDIWRESNYSCRTLFNGVFD